MICCILYNTKSSRMWGQKISTTTEENLTVSKKILAITFDNFHMYDGNKIEKVSSDLIFFVRLQDVYNNSCG